MPRTENYEDNKVRAQSLEVAVRRELASRPDTEPEILYYLTDDEAKDVRRNLAENPATPDKANLRLSRDEDVEVRMELARKICRLLPDLSGEEAAVLLERTVEVLEILAEDQLAAVRAIVARSLKGTYNAPPHIIQALARDVEEIVASPILEYSPLLSNEDLLEIMAGGVAIGALPAIARRKDISEEVSAELVTSLEVPAIAALLANPSAKIREETLDEIMDQAEKLESLHVPLIMRLDLSLRAMRRIAGFVASSLVEQLVAKHELSADLEAELKEIVRSRIEATEQFSSLNDPETGRDQAEALWQKGGLDEEAMSEALDARKNNFVIKGLSLLSGFDDQAVEKILASRNGKAVTALCWKAGLSMRFAFRVETAIAHVPRGDIVNARNGIEFPFTDEEMEWQLSFFGG